MSNHIQSGSEVLKQLYKNDAEDRRSKNWNRATKKELRCLKRLDKKRRDTGIFLDQLNQITTALDYHHGHLSYYTQTRPRLCSC
jgi:hypothetical protein